MHVIVVRFIAAEEACRDDTHMFACVEKNLFSKYICE